MHYVWFSIGICPSTPFLGSSESSSGIMSWASLWRPTRPAAWVHPTMRQPPLASPTHSGAPSIRCWSTKREVKDPRSFDSMDQLREQLEQTSSPGLVTSLVNWLSKAAATTASGFDLKAIYKRLLAMAQPSSGGNGWADELAELDRLEAEVGQETVQQLATVLLGTRQSTLRIIRRYPAILSMNRSHIMERLIWLKGEFPGSDVTRMVELQAAAFLGGDWHSVRKQLAAAAQTLREGLQGANFDFMFQEDPAILHEDVDSLRMGVRQLHELWAVDEAALANSSPLHLTLAVRALGPKGPPRKF